MVRKTKPSTEEPPKKKTNGPYRITKEWLKGFRLNQLLVAEQRESLRRAAIRTNDVEPCYIDPTEELARYSDGDLASSSR